MASEGFAAMPPSSWFSAMNFWIPCAPLAAASFTACGVMTPTTFPAAFRSGLPTQAATFPTPAPSAVSTAVWRLRRSLPCSSDAPAPKSAPPAIGAPVPSATVCAARPTSFFTSA